MDRVKEPIIKAGDVRKDYNGNEYEVLRVSNTYDEVSMYDSMNGCLELDLENILYCAAKKHMPNLKQGMFLKTFVFLISRDSKILGE